MTRGGGGGWGGGGLGAGGPGGAGCFFGRDGHALGGGSRAVEGRVHGVEYKIGAAILLDAAARVKSAASLAFGISYFGPQRGDRAQERAGVWETDLWSIMTDEQLQASSVQCAYLLTTL